MSIAGIIENYRNLHNQLESEAGATEEAHLDAIGTKCDRLMERIVGYETVAAKDVFDKFLFLVRHLARRAYPPESDPVIASLMELALSLVPASARTRTRNRGPRGAQRTVSP